MSVDSVNRVKYTGLDFDTHFDDLRAQLQTNYADDFNDFALSSLGIMLLDLVSYGLDTVSFYGDRRATDLYLSTARTRKAVSRLCRQLGYKMAAAIASSVDLEVALQTAQVFDVPIPKGFQFKGPNDLVFEVAQATTFTAGSGPANVKTIPCYEGETFTETFVSDGTANQVFELRRVPDQKYVVFGTVTVTVNGSAYTENEFLTVEATNQFEVAYNDEPPSIRFGDGVTGNIPATGSSIVVTYVASRGKAGQVANNTIDDVVTPLIVSFTNINLSINNPKAAVGGDDPEDLEHAKSFAGRWFKARQVAVTRSDYETLAGSFADPLAGRVAVGQAFSPRSAASDLTMQTYLSSITNAVALPKPAVDTNTAAIETTLTSIDTKLASILTDLNDIAGHVTTANSNVDTAITAARAVKNVSNEIEINATDIQAQVVSGKAAIDLIATAGSDQLQASTKLALKAYFDSINSEAGQIVTQANTIETSATAEIAAMGVVKDRLTLIGTSTASGELLSLATLRTSIITDLGVAGPPSTGIRANVDAVQAAVTDVTTAVATQTANINAHMDAILAADCKANLVTVPILARDAAGFYAAPSTSLIQALQTYLDARKEVTQTVSVTSGELFLIKAVISVRVGITTGISAQVTKTAIETAIDAILRGRKFGASLYLSDFNGLKSINGVSFVNVTINGHLATDGVSILTSKRDASGNLIIDDSEVITKGTVTVATPEVVVTN